jgi:hypothetical protein
MLAFCAVTWLFERWRSTRLVAGAMLALLVSSSFRLGFARPPRIDRSQEWAEKAPLFGKVPVVVVIPPDWNINVPGP